MSLEELYGAQVADSYEEYMQDKLQDSEHYAEPYNQRLGLRPVSWSDFEHEQLP